MKKEINTNKLQNDISKVLREVEAGDVYEVIRYSKSVAYLISKKDYQHLIENRDCKKCVEDLRKISKKLKS